MKVETGIAKGRKMTSSKSIRTDVTDAGAKWEDSPAVGVITSRSPGDLEASSAKIIEEFKEAAVRTQCSIGRQTGRCRVDWDGGSAVRGLSFQHEQRIRQRAGR